MHEVLQQELVRFASGLTDARSELDVATATRAARSWLLLSTCFRFAAPSFDWERVCEETRGLAPDALMAPWLQAVKHVPPGLTMSAGLTEFQPEDVAQALLNWRLSRGRADRAFRATAAVERRRTGSHYTPSVLARLAVERALEPLIAANPEALLDLRICDPALGAGIFLEQVGRLLSEQLERAGWAAEAARATTYATCLYGIDRSELAVWLSRLQLWRAAAVSGELGDRVALALCEHLVVDDALRGDLTAGGASVRREKWRQAFQHVFSGTNPGFSAVVGNPPWIAFVGRAAQPLTKAVSDGFVRRFAAFHKYRTLHGLFVERATQLLRQGGRLGFILPTSVADLEGYRPTRSAHDARCVADEQLPSFPDGVFDGVFQPCMVLLSERRDNGAPDPGAPWDLAREDVGTDDQSLLLRLRTLPTLPAHLFGERGYQTTARDVLLEATTAPSAAHVPLRTGSEVGEYRCRPPRLFAAPEQLHSRFRDAADWQSVRLLIRQTARYPIAARSDGLAFRNSILAGFEDDAFSWELLLSYLNSTPLRWYYYHAQRDAREGMPQVKIGHLRALPCPPQRNTPLGQELHRVGAELGCANVGIAPEQRLAIDRLVAQAWGLTEHELQRVLVWGAANAPPEPRRSAAPSKSRAAAPGPRSAEAGLLPRVGTEAGPGTEPGLADAACTPGVTP